MTKISVIIVNYNVRDLLLNCLQSLYKSKTNDIELEIFVVDNNSVDKSLEAVNEHYPAVKTISLKENLGFSKANNIALKQASGQYILILNPDTVVEETTFKKLLQFVKEHQDTGAVTSKLILANGKLDSACKRSFPTPSVALPRILGLSKLFPKSKIFGKYNLTYLDENKLHEVDAICGAFMFMPKHVLDKAGLFDEDYFMYGEDLDLCYRIKKAGFKIYYYPDITTIHYKGESTKKTGLSYVNNFYGAMSIFVKKNFKGSPKLLSAALQIGIYYRSVFSYASRIISYITPILLDAVLLFAAHIISVKLRFDVFPNKDYLFIISIYVIVWLLLLSLTGIYFKKNRLRLRKVFNAIIAGFLINSSITYFFKEYAFSREVILSSTVISLVFLLSWRGMLRINNFIQRKNILLKKINVLIVGDKPLNQNIEDKLSSRYNIYYYSKFNKPNTANDLREVVLINKISDVILSDESFPNNQLLSAMWQLKNMNINFKILPSGKDLMLSSFDTNINEASLIEIEYNINNKINIFLKRFFDIVLSFLLIFTVFPVIWLIKLLFRKSFSKESSKLFLIPKVFSGEYSFVGIPVWYKLNSNEHFGKKGLTGLIQLYYYPEISTEEMNNYILFYAKNQSLLLDLEILLKTLFAFLRK